MVSLRRPTVACILIVYLSRRRSRHPIGFQLFILSCQIFIIVLSIIIFAHEAFMHAFVISFVRTILRVLSKYSPGLLIWPDVDEGDLVDEEFNSKSDA